MSDLLVAFITTTSVLSDVSVEQKEGVVCLHEKSWPQCHKLG